MKWIDPMFFSKCSGNPIFGQIIGHQRAENEARNTKMYRVDRPHKDKCQVWNEISQ